jgi:succinoglycan biosynthesis transport protein ExoP
MATAQNVKEISLGRFTAVLRKHKLCAILTTLLITAGVVVYIYGEPTTYKAEAMLSDDTSVQDYVKPSNGMPANPTNVQDKMWLIREHLFSPVVLQPLIQDFHLDERANDWGARFDDLRHQLADIFPSMQSAPSNQISQERLFQALKSRIVVQVEAPDAFSLAFVGKDPEQSMNVTNRLADALVQRTVAANEKNSSFAADFLKSEVDRVKQKLDRQNAEIQAYHEQTADDLSTRMASDLRLLEDLQQRLHSKTEQISTEQAHRIAVQNELRDLEQRGALDSKEKTAAQTQLEALRMKLKQLQAMYTEEHPEIKSTQKEIRDLEKTVATNADSQDVAHGEPSTAQMRYVGLKAEMQASDQLLQSYRKQESDLAAQLANYQKRAQTAPRTERVLADLVREYELTRADYQMLLQKQTQAQIDERLNKTNQSAVFHIVRPARLPLTPFGPHRVRISLGGLFAGLGLAVGLVFLLETRDTAYDTADEFQESIDLPVLAAIPAITGKDQIRPLPVNRSLAITGPAKPMQIEAKALPKNTIVTWNDPSSIASEQYGLLAMEVRQRLGRDRSRILAITSPAGGEGKTVTSLNLSIALSKAMEGQVLLVECDLRKPRIHEYMGMRPDKGFSDLLQRPDDPIEPYVWRLNGLAVIPGGPVLQDPLKLLASSRTQGLFQRLREQYKFIVVDLPPIVPIADSHVVSGLVDGVLLVVRARHTRRELLKHALRSFHASNIIGVVLNAVDLQQTNYYYAYDYYSNEYIGKDNNKQRVSA